MGQSSNDLIPTAIHVAALEGVEKRLIPALEALAAALDERARTFDSVVKIGRTHLQDAVPIRLGQEFSGYAAGVTHESAGSRGVAASRWEKLAIGGNGGRRDGDQRAHGVPAADGRARPGHRPGVPAGGRTAERRWPTATPALGPSGH